MAFQATRSQEQKVRLTHENTGQPANGTRIKNAREIAEKRGREK
jgi:hypothetical protein